MAQELIISTADLAIVVTELQGKATDLLEQSERAEITDIKSNENGTDFLKIVSGITKRLEDRRKVLVDDYTKRIRVINQAFKPVRDTLGVSSTNVKRKMGVWYDAEEKKNREIQARQKREAEEAALAAAEKIEKEGDAATAEAILNMAAEVPQASPKPVVSRGTLTGATAVATKVWTGEVVDIKMVCQAVTNGLLPEDMITISSSKLNELARKWHFQSPDDDVIQRLGIRAEGRNRMSAR